MAENAQWGDRGARFGNRSSGRSDRIPLVSPIWPRKDDGAWEFEIVGIFDGAKKGTDTSGFYFRYDYFDEARRVRRRAGGMGME